LWLVPFHQFNIVVRVIALFFSFAGGCAHGDARMQLGRWQWHDEQVLCMRLFSLLYWYMVVIYQVPDERMQMGSWLLLGQWPQVQRAKIRQMANGCPFGWWRRPCVNGDTASGHFDLC